MTFVIPGASVSANSNAPSSMPALVLPRHDLRLEALIAKQPHLQRRDFAFRHIHRAYRYGTVIVLRENPSKVDGGICRFTGCKWCRRDKFPNHAVHTAHVKAC